MQGKGKTDVDFERSVRYQGGYFNPNSSYIPMPKSCGDERLLEEVLEMQNRTHQSLIKQMDQLFLALDSKISHLRLDFGRLFQRVEELERIVAERKVTKRPVVVQAVHAEKIRGNEVREETSEEGSSDTVGRLPSMVGRRINGRWTIQNVDRPEEREAEAVCPLMKLPPKKNAYDAWVTTQSVLPWVVIDQFEIDDVEVESDT